MALAPGLQIEVGKHCLEKHNLLVGMGLEKVQLAMKQ